MHKKDILVGSSGIIAVLVTKVIIQSIGIDNVELRMRILILFGLVTLFSIKSIREKDKNVRKYSIIASIILFAFSILLTIGMIIKEGFPQYHSVVKVPLGILIFILFTSILIPMYKAGSYKSR